MWSVELEGLVGLTPAEQLWVIAQVMEENGGPAAYVAALRGIAARLEEVGWWLAEPSKESSGDESDRLREPSSPISRNVFL